MNAFYDQYGDPYTGLVGSAKDDLNDSVVRGTMLDGSYSVQMVGEPAKILNVEFYCSEDTRKQVQMAKAYGEHVTVLWHDVSYAGYIDNLKYKPFWPKKVDRQEKVEIVLLVDEETIGG